MLMHVFFVLVQSYTRRYALYYILKITISVFDTRVEYMKV